MKKLFLAFDFTLVISGIANAQFTQGQKVLAGNISFSTGKNNLSQNPNTINSYRSVSFSPSFGSFIKQDVLQGFGLSYSYISRKSMDINTAVNTSDYSHLIGLTIFRQKFIPLSSKFYFTLRGAFSAVYNFGRQESTFEQNILEYKTSGYSLFFDFAPGISYKISERFLLDANLLNFISVGYNHSDRQRVQPVNPELKTTSHEFNLSTSLGSSTLDNIGIGFRYLLRKP